MTRASSRMALAPFSGSSPEWAALPKTRSVKRSDPLRRVLRSPAAPERRLEHEDPAHPAGERLDARQRLGAADLLVGVDEEGRLDRGVEAEVAQRAQGEDPLHQPALHVVDAGAGEAAVAGSRPASARQSPAARRCRSGRAGAAPARPAGAPAAPPRAGRPVLRRRAGPAGAGCASPPPRAPRRGGRRPGSWAAGSWDGDSSRARSAQQGGHLVLAGAEMGEEGLGGSFTAGMVADRGEGRGRRGALALTPDGAWVRSSAAAPALTTPALLSQPPADRRERCGRRATRFESPPSRRSGGGRERGGRGVRALEAQAAPATKVPRSPDSCLLP